MQGNYVSIDRVVDFVDRTTARGAPLRVATKRAERRFGVPRHIIHSFVVARSPEFR